MTFFTSIISRNREALASDLVCQIDKHFSRLPSFKGVSILQHMGTYPSLQAIKSRLGSSLVLDESSKELDPVRGGLGFLRNQAIQTGMDRFRVEGRENDYVLVLDDDIQLYNFSPAVLLEALDYMCASSNTAMMQLAHKERELTPSTVLEKRHICTTGGGTLVRLSMWKEVGGYGDDYFDTPELSLKFLSRGYDTYRFNPRFSRHNYLKEGGLKELFPNKKSCNEMRHLSMLAEEYPSLVQKDPDAWLGFSKIPLAF